MSISRVAGLVAAAAAPCILGSQLLRGGDANANANSNADGDELEGASAEGALSSVARLAMHPELVATLLGNVEESWVQDRRSVLVGSAQDSPARTTMLTSCKKVGGAIIQGAGGEYKKASMYMQEVCQKFHGFSGDDSMCKEFADSVVVAMQGDPEFNRNQLNLTSSCLQFYDGPVRTAAMSTPTFASASTTAPLEIEEVNAEKTASSEEAEVEKVSARADQMVTEAQEAEAKALMEAEVSKAQTGNVTVNVANKDMKGSTTAANATVSNTTVPNSTLTNLTATNATAGNTTKKM